MPACSKLLPHMAVSLRDLELLPYDDILPPGGGEAKYERLASIDSPFREQLAWAYLRVGSRPGVPDRDIETWAEDVLACDPPWCEGSA